ncbi:MAG: SDR family oxidoreductase, partial [Myxococcota bacterium]
VRTAALELAKDGITVNAICPGWVDTDLLDGALQNIAAKTKGTKAAARQRIEAMIPMGKILTPDEIAGLLAYIVSPAARHLTGQALVLDGGETL